MGYTQTFAGAASATSAVSAASEHKTDAAVSITQDFQGWAADLTGGTRSLFGTDADGSIAWTSPNIDNIADGAENNIKVIGVSTSSGLAGLAGHAADGLDVLTNQFDFSKNWIPDGNYSDIFAKKTMDFGMDVSENHLGGAPSLDTAWSQVANVGGGFIGPQFASKAISLTGKAKSLIGGLFNKNPTANNALTSAPALVATP